MKASGASALHVAILGGGVAGLTCADELVQRGFNVIVYERRPPREIGGKARNYTARLLDANGIKLPTRAVAEHGFRFFPGFYQHINATTKKIPISANLATILSAEGRKGEPAAPKSVFDCLLPINTEVLAVPGKQALEVPSSAPLKVRTLRGVFQLPQQLLEIGLTNDDLSAFSDKLWQIATSCQERRDQEYERIAWRDFVKSKDRSEEYYWYLASGLTRGLVAARAREASTKTMGNLALRFWTSLSRADDTTDRVLCGPTSVVWLKPWIAHIYSMARARKTVFDIQQVEIDGLDVKEAKIQKAHAGGKVLTADYFISALPVEMISKLIQDNPALKKAGGEQFSNLVKLASPKHGFLRRMSGIQIYLKKDVPLNRGHQFYLDSSWGLTAISQAQFWSHKLRDMSLPKGASGVLSVDISSWDLPGVFNGRNASECTQLEIFREVVAQIGSALGKELRIALFGNAHSNILGWHLDNPRDRNFEHLLVNDVGSWALRPEAETALENFFLAGDFARTTTDLACMEGANEAARRAVNALIAHAKAKAKAKAKATKSTSIDHIRECPLFSVPQSAIFMTLQQIDSYRYRRGLPWSGVSVGKWLLRGTQAGAAVDEVVFANGTQEPLLLIRNGKGIAVPAPSPGPTFRLPREVWDDRSQRAVPVEALTPEQVERRLTGRFASGGRADPMFERWRPYQLLKDPGQERNPRTIQCPRMIPFHAYDAEGVILYGKANNLSWLEAQTRGTAWYPARSRVNGRPTGFAELWVINYGDTTTGPYRELVINFAVTEDPRKPEYVWNSSYSALLAMNDPTNRLFAPALLLDELYPLEGGPITYGNDLLGTNKKPAKIKITTTGSIKAFSCTDDKGLKVLEGSVDTKVYPLDAAVGSIELARQFGALATVQEFRQRAENAELNGGIVTKDFRVKGGETAKVVEILAAYKFAPTLGVFREGENGTYRLVDKKSEFANIVDSMGFEPVLFAHDPHLKTVLYIDGWPTPDGT